MGIVIIETEQDLIISHRKYNTFVERAGRNDSYHGSTPQADGIEINSLWKYPKTALGDN